MFVHFSASNHSRFTSEFLLRCFEAMPGATDDELMCCPTVVPAVAWLHSREHRQLRRRALISVCLVRDPPSAGRLRWMTNTSPWSRSCVDSLGLLDKENMGLEQTILEHRCDERTSNSLEFEQNIWWFFFCFFFCLFPSIVSPHLLYRF